MTVSLIPHTPEGKPQDISDVSCLLWAVGRDANMVDLRISATGVELTKRGFIKVDGFQNTNVENMYALGDIAGNKLLTPGRWMGKGSSFYYNYSRMHPHPFPHPFPLPPLLPPP